MSPARRAVRVYVNPRGRDWIRSASNHPSAAVESVSVPLVIAGHEIHHEQVIGGRIQSEESTLRIKYYIYIYIYVLFYRSCYEILIRKAISFFLHLRSLSTRNFFWEYIRS